MLIYLGDNAFQACSFLSQVTLVNGLKYIGAKMFYMVDGNNAAVPNSLTSITIPHS